MKKEKPEKKLLNPMTPEEARQEVAGLIGKFVGTQFHYLQEAITLLKRAHVEMSPRGRDHFEDYSLIEDIDQFLHPKTEPK